MKKDLMDRPYDLNEMQPVPTPTRCLECCKHRILLGLSEHPETRYVTAFIKHLKEEH